MESEELLKDLLAIPRSAAFNRVRYIGQLMGESEQMEFIKGLFAKAVESREAKNPEALFDFLETWEEKGMAIAAGRARAPFELGAAPWSPLNVPISEAKVALVTTGGFYVAGQEPYVTDGPENKGDYSFRPIPRNTPADKLEVAHLHYDLAGPKEDRNCVFPIDRAEELLKDGVVGSLADTYYSFMGFIQEPEILAKETAPEVARLLKADGVDAVVITATWPICNRSGGLIARAFEAEGIATVLVMMNSGLAEVLEPPRVARVRFPFGRPMGEPSNPDQSRVILEDALEILETATEPGTVVHLPYRWRRENYAQIRQDRAKARTRP